MDAFTRVVFVVIGINLVILTIAHGVESGAVLEWNAKKVIPLDDNVARAVFFAMKGEVV